MWRLMAHGIPGSTDSLQTQHEAKVHSRVSHAGRLAPACRPAQYPPIRYGTHLESKVLTNFEL